MKTYKWVVCNSGIGIQIIDGQPNKYKTNFNIDSVGLIESENDDFYIVWLIGSDTKWQIDKKEVKFINVLETGDKFKTKICNICHCLKPIEHFSRNQTNLHGILRRPSCKKCRTDIDKRSPRTKQVKEMEKSKPTIGTPFRCPICTKRSIVGITAKIVADHDHHTGNIRDFICDSCNTGLGRFKNGENYLMNAVNYIKERDTLKHR